MKKIEDYLKYYLGTGVDCEAGNPDAVVVSAEMAWLHQDRYKWVKPILRPLSSMTGEEASEIWKILGWNERIPKEHRAEDILREFDTIEGEHGEGQNASWKYLVEILPYILSRGFDLFGLIEEGLAIDSTLKPAIQ